jgi:hypothetical protein
MENLLISSFSYEDFPKLIGDFLKENKKIGLILEEKESTNQISIGVQKIYTQRVMDISENINKKYAYKEKDGYTREEAVKDFLAAKAEIERIL